MLQRVIVTAYDLAAVISIDFMTGVVKGMIVSVFTTVVDGVLRTIVTGALTTCVFKVVLRELFKTIVTGALDAGMVTALGLGSSNATICLSQ